MRRMWSTMFVLSGLIAQAGCSDSSTSVASPNAGAQSTLQALLTGDAAASIDRGGVFASVVRSPADGGPQEISVDRAKEIAGAWATHYAPLLSSYYDAQRGAPITWGALSVCGRALYAASPFEPPPANVPLSVRRAFGPWWLLSVCGAGGDPELSVAVSAWATDLQIVDRRNPLDDRPPSVLRPGVLLSGPQRSGVYLVPRAIPAGGPPADEAFLLSPERAVEMVVALTGGAVTEVPELIKMPDVAPQLASWRVKIGKEVSVRDLEAGGIAQASEFFVGFYAPGNAKGRTAVMIADAAQPTSRAFRYIPTAALLQGSVGGASSVSETVRRRGSYPTRLKPVGPVSTGGQP